MWPTDLESIPYASTRTLIISTMFEVDMTIRCRVTAFFFCWYVTWPGDLDLWLFYLNSYPTWRVTWPILPPSLKTLRLFVHELRVITFPVGYHWKCVRGHIACAVSRDPWVGGKNDYIFGTHDPDLPIHYTTSVALRWILLKLSAKIMLALC